MTRWLSDDEVMCHVLGWFDPRGIGYWAKRGGNPKKIKREMAETTCPTCGKVRTVPARDLRKRRRDLGGREPCCSISCGRKKGRN